MRFLRGNKLVCSFGAAAWLLGCQPSVEDPIRAASRFVAVAGYGQGVSIWPHLSEKTRLILEREAERASNQIGERRNISPSEMLQIVDVPTFDPRRIPELRSRSETTAEVVFFDMKGTEYPVKMFLEEEQWRVNLPLDDSLSRGARP
jgi:hypothetical protein